MSREAFIAFLEARGWKLVEEYVPAHEYEDEETGEVEWVEAYTARSILRDEPFGEGTFLYQMLDVPSGLDVFEADEEMWATFVRLGDLEFEALRERETAKAGC